MKKILARDEYELPLNENDVVYQDYEEFIEDIRVEALSLEYHPTVEPGDRMQYLFESQEANWYIRLDEDRFAQVNPKTVRTSKTTAALAKKAYTDIFLDDDACEY